MEILVFGVIILVLCLILGVNINYIMYAILGIVGLVSCMMTLLFIYANICLLLSKRKEASFLRFESVNGKFSVACYLIEDKEYLCAFPREAIMQDKLYDVDKTYHVMLNKKTGKVYDRYSIATCILGLTFGIIICLSIYKII